MTTHRSVRTCACFATAVFFLLGFSQRSFGGDAPRPVLSLTAAERANLPDETSVTIPWRGTVTLGQLRAEHRARLDRFSRAGLWGKRLADKLPKPTPLAGASTNALTNAQPPAGNKVVSNGVVQMQNSSALGQGAGVTFNSGIQNTKAPGGITKTSTTVAGLQPMQSGTGGGIQSNKAISQANASLAGQRQNSGTGAAGLGGGPLNGGSVVLGGNGKNVLGAGANQIQPSGALGQPSGGTGQNVLSGGVQLSGPVSPSAGGTKVAGTATLSPNLFLVPREAYSWPIPIDYVGFCNAAQASACIYLPPNTTFVILGPSNPLQKSIQGLQGQTDGLVVDVDPLITDAGICSSFGGTLDLYQSCEFTYFSSQETKFKPAGTPASAASCSQPSYYEFDRKAGTIDATYPLPFNLSQTMWTGASPATCVVQVWLYP